MQPTTSNWKISLVESEERMLRAIAACMHQLAEQIHSLAKVDCFDELSEIEQRLISTLSLLQIIHVNVLQRKWLLADLCQSTFKMNKEHVEMITAIQELDQALELYNFISGHSSRKLKLILKQISAHYYSTVKVFILGNPSPPPPWKPSLKQKGD